MLEESSFGIVPLSKVAGEWNVFLVQHRRGRHWGFPKGHAQLLETSELAAMRELKEETNLDIISFLSTEPLQECYQISRGGREVLKNVFYFIAEVEGLVRLQKEEIVNGLWFTFQKAKNTLTHSEGKAILRQVEQLLCHRSPFI